MLVKTYASAVQGVEAQMITVEVNAGGNVTVGTNFYHLVGLPGSNQKYRLQDVSVETCG